MKGKMHCLVKVLDPTTMEYIHVIVKDKNALVGLHIPVSLVQDEKKKKQELLGT